MKCPKCNWTGEDSELIEEKAELTINDGFTGAINIMAAKRINYLCPKCRTLLRTAKFMYGGEVESEDL